MLSKDGPLEWKKLNSQFNKASDDYHHELLLEFDLKELADLWKNDQSAYDKLREKGRRAVFHRDAQLDALKEIVACYGRDARLAASANAYSAAVTLLGSALEGILLIRCLKSEQKAVRIAKSIRKPRKINPVNEPVKWALESLIEVCFKAGWLPAAEFGARASQNAKPNTSWKNCA